MLVLILPDGLRAFDDHIAVRLHLDDRHRDIAREIARILGRSVRLPRIGSSRRSRSQKIKDARARIERRRS